MIFNAECYTVVGPKFVNKKLHWATTGGDGWSIMSIDLVDEK